MDPGDLEPPFSFDIKIAPLDDTGTPVDDFETEVVVEKKGVPSCDISIPDEQWNWIWTTVDGTINSAPDYGQVSEHKVNGCCWEGFTVDCISNGIPESQWISMDYVSAYFIEYEVISFTDNGHFTGGLGESTQNIDPSESDFRNGIPEYVRRITDHLFWGNYTYNPSDGKIQFSNLETREQEIYLDELDLTVTQYDKCFLEPQYLYEIISCHFLMETSNVEGQSKIRLFERNGGGSTWYD